MYLYLGSLDFVNKTGKWAHYRCELVVPNKDIYPSVPNAAVHIRFIYCNVGSAIPLWPLESKESESEGLGHNIKVDGQNIFFMTEFENNVRKITPTKLTYKVPRESKRKRGCLVNVESDSMESDKMREMFKKLSRCGSLKRWRELGTRFDHPSSGYESQRRRRLLPSGGESQRIQAGDEAQRRMRRLADLEDRYSEKE